jgi:hypothetical protein
MTLLLIKRGGTRLHSVENTFGTGYGSAVSPRDGKSDDDAENKCIECAGIVLSFLRDF